MNNDNLLPDETLSQKLLKKGFWLYLFTYLAAPAGYLIRVIISNSISVEEVGVLYSVIGFVGLISIYNDLGLTQSLQYFLPKFWIKKQYNYVKTSIFISLGMQILTALLIIIILWFGADWLGIHYFKYEIAGKILKFFCFYFLGINLFQVVKSIFSSFQDTFRYKLIDFVQLWSVFIFVIIFSFLGKGNIINFSISWISGMFVSLSLALFLFLIKYKHLFQKGKLVYDKVMIKKYRKYALWVFIGANAGLLLGQIDQQMIIILLGAKMAGYYANYLSLLAINSIVIGPILGLLFPIISELIAKNDGEKIRLLQNFMYTYMVVFAFSLSGLFVSLGSEIAISLFGENFLFSGSLLVFGGGFLFLSILLSISFSILIGLGKVKERVKIIMLAGFFNIIMNLIFMNFWGIYGIIVSTILGNILMVVLSTRLVYKNEKISIQWGFMIKNIILIFVLSLVVYVLKDNVFILENNHRLDNLLMLVIVGFFYYLIFFGVNFKQILLLKREIGKLKRG